MSKFLKAKKKVSTHNIDSIYKYIADTKPYHTKIHEVVVELVFRDKISIQTKDAP
jgi:hypothetical protein